MKLFHNLLLPAIALMNRLRFSAKIGLIGLLFLVPVAVLAVLLLNKYGVELSFARSERNGVQVIRPAREALQALQDHRAASRALAAGEAGAASRLTDLGGKVDKAFLAIVELDRLYGEEFKTQAAWSGIRGAWAKLKAEVRALNAEASYARHSEVIELLISYMIATADGSNLSLDPDLDTYYLMDAVVFRVPSVVESVERMRGQGVEIVARKAITTDERVEFGALGKLTEVDFGAFHAGLAKVFGYNPTSKSRLEPKVKAAAVSVGNFRADVHKRLVKADRIDADVKAYGVAGTAAVLSLFEAFDEAAQELDDLLAARISRLVTSRNEVIAGIVVVLAGVLYLFFGFLMGVRLSLDEIRGAADRIATGDLTSAVLCSTRDELRDISNAVGKVRDRINDVAAAQVEMAVKHGEGAVSHRIEAGRFPGAYGELAAKVNELVEQHIEVSRQTVEVVGEYARGNLVPDMARLPGEQAAITGAMDGVKRQLLGINGEIKRLVDAAAAGDFGVRGEDAAYSHTFGEMVAGLNRLMETCQGGLDEVSRVMGRIAQGDLSARMEGRYEGAFQRIKEDCNATAEQLGVIVNDIRNATETINTAAREISAGNTDLSQRTEEQASSLEETAASMEELTVTVKQNTESARQANQLAVSASEIAARGGERVTEVVSTMDAISSSSKKIADIIGVIDGIAFQTNILALNAAVEAARAGEQGRGFAVVATEVRNLAQRSAEAAREIKGLIGDSVQKVEAGAKLVADAGATMDEIVGAVKRVTGIMGEITAASVEQSAGIEQVSQAVAQMDKVTQQNAALVEQAAAAAESMEDQTNGLSNTVAVFRLQANATGAPVEEAPPVQVAGRAPKRAKAQAHPVPAAADASSSTSDQEKGESAEF